MTPRRRQGTTLDDSAVSDVVGQLLMVAATVVVGSGFILILLSLPPPASEGRVDVGAFILPQATNRLVLEHQGGNDLDFDRVQVVVVVNNSRTVANLGERLAASDPAWRVVDAAGTTKAATATWRTGDQVWYTSTALLGQSVRVDVADLDTRSALLTPTTVQAADATPPTLSSARTASTTTVLATFSERLSNVSAGDFTLTGLTIQSARLVGLGDQALVTTTTSFATSATPTLTVAAVPAATYDLGGNRLTGSTAVVASDGVAPAITFTSATPGNTSATIAFNTSETATPTIAYGPTLVYGLTSSGPSGTSHSLAIGSLTSGTTYHYRIYAVDAAGNNNTGDAARSLATTGGGGGSSSGTGTNYLEWTTVVTPLNPGIVSSSTYTITLRDSTGAAVTPSSLQVRLHSNSSLGTFYDSTGTSPITHVTMSSSTATFRYIDSRPFGTSLLVASANNTVPGTTHVQLTNRGNLVPRAGDSLSSVIVNVLYPREQDRAEDPMLGVSVTNPTPSAKTISAITLWAHPGLPAGFFQATVTAGAGSDVSCSWSGAATDQLACTGLSYTLPAYSVMQVTVTFRNSNSGTDAFTMLTANVSFSSPSGTVQSAPSKFVFHEGTANSAIMVRILASATSGGTERASFALTGGSAADLYFEWHSLRTSGTSSLYERIQIPAGWTNVGVPTVPVGFGVRITQPTATAPGLVEVSHNAPASAATQELMIRATPPAITGVDEIFIERTTAGGTAFDVWESTAIFGVQIS